MLLILISSVGAGKSCYSWGRDDLGAVFQKTINNTVSSFFAVTDSADIWFFS